MEVKTENKAEKMFLSEISNWLVSHSQFGKKTPNQYYIEGNTWQSRKCFFWSFHGNIYKTKEGKNQRARPCNNMIPSASCIYTVLHCCYSTTHCGARGAAGDSGHLDVNEFCSSIPTWARKLYTSTTFIVKRDFHSKRDQHKCFWGPLVELELSSQQGQLHSKIQLKSLSN